MTKLTISEYAALKNISVQAVYKKKHTLNTVEEVRNGRKQLFIIVEEEDNKLQSTNSTPEVEAVEAVETANKSNSTDNSTPEVETVEENLNANQRQFNNEIKLISTDYIDYLKEQIEELKQEKKQTEERLRATITEKDEIIKQQAEQLAVLAKQAQEIAAKAITAKALQDYSSVVDKQDTEAPEEETIIDVKPKKRKFWEWLFQ